jgi:two-component sensor histidine kinase
MAINSFINRIGNIGVKKNYQPWEILLTRKLNLSSFLGFINVCIGFFLFLLIGYYGSVIEFLVVMALAPVVLFLNSKFNYISASYLFTLIGCFLFFFLSVKTGPEAFSILYFFPFVLVLTQMLGRSETYFHLVIQFVFCSITIFAIIFSFHFEIFKVVISESLIAPIMYINILLSFFIAFAFIFIISFDANKQEKQLKSALKEKEILLAELFHRVKNNLNLVTSLLNLKKNTITSKEAQDAIDECRNMVFSMALIHTRIYNSNNIDSLDFKEYLNVLANELINSFGGKDNLEVELNSEPINLSLTQAIPCGLIINEFITNSFKHGQIAGRKLKVDLKLKEYQGEIIIELKDNGPGNMTQQQEKNSLGLGLIKSLTEQLDGESNFSNNNGLQFNLKFKK